jgi:hypothetical protein
MKLDKQMLKNLFRWKVKSRSLRNGIARVEFEPVELNAETEYYRWEWLEIEERTPKGKKKPEYTVWYQVEFGNFITANNGRKFWHYKRTFPWKVTLTVEEDAVNFALQLRNHLETWWTWSQFKGVIEPDTLQFIRDIHAPKTKGDKRWVKK